MRLSCVLALQRWSFMTDACESIHYLGFITVIELSLPCFRAKLLGLKSCEVLNQKQAEPPLCLSYSKNVISSPNVHPSTLSLSLSPSLCSFLSNALPLSVLALELLEKCTPLKRRSLIRVQKKSSKSPWSTRFPPSHKTLRYLSEHIR